MDEEIRCQSCGMPIGEEFFGTESDGSVSHDYCYMCYAKGAFLLPDLTVEGRIDLSVDNMVNDLGMTEDQAEKLAHDFIPHLKRWKH